jgi:ABC-type sugar transport system ATPase subunit
MAFAGIADSERRGIIIIHQELALIPLLSIAENIFLGNECAKMAASFPGSRPTSEPKALLKKVGLREAPQTMVDRTGRGQATVGRDRQGSVERGAAADPRRADGRTCPNPTARRFGTSFWNSRRRA